MASVIGIQPWTEFQGSTATSMHSVANPCRTQPLTGTQGTAVSLQIQVTSTVSTQLGIWVNCHVTATNRQHQQDILPKLLKRETSELTSEADAGEEQKDNMGEQKRKRQRTKEERDNDVQHKHGGHEWADGVTVEGYKSDGTEGKGQQKDWKGIGRSNM